jgi:ankyrin repeat protein
MSKNEKPSLGRLRYAIKKKLNDEAIAIIQEYGIDTFYKDLGSAILIACMTENWDIAKYCVLNGANVNVLDYEKGTPLIHACKMGNFEIVKMLIEAGADINAVNKYDRSPIAKAIENNPEKYDLIQFLIDNGADPFFEENYLKDDPRITTHSAYEYAKKEIKDEHLIAILEKARK